MTYAVVCPGQGAQHVGMGKALYDACDAAKEIFKRADHCLGADLTALCFEGDPQELTRTDRCQPAIYTTSCAAWHALASSHVLEAPVMTAGLSLGEYAAMTIAGGWSFETGLQLVHTRGEAMAAASQQRPGAMTAIMHVDVERVQEMCRQTDTEVANLNCPGQVVVSGAVTGIAQIEALAKAAGAKRVMRLDVGGAFHSALMEPARHSMERALQRVQIQSLTCPVVCNVTAQPTTNPAQLRANLVAQLTRPTLWIDSMRALIGQGITQFIELAPAKVLAGLQKRIDPSAHTQPINTPEDLHVLSTISP